MLHILRARLHQQYRTYPFPEKKPVLSQRYTGRPLIKGDGCVTDCSACAQVCPVGAISRSSAGKPVIDLGRCIFCHACEAACPAGLISFSSEFALATSNKEDLIVNSDKFNIASALPEEYKRLFGRSMKLRQVSAGGCNACEADCNVLNTPAFDLARFGIQFVASPRHADGLLITGPVTQNMKLALVKTYEALPSPKIVIATGACAISGGLFRDNPEVNNGVGDIVPVDLYIPGCPPNPWTILDGMLRLMGRI
ncbi:MAG: hydrogenase [Candidatus Riflebacteria bacterium HGW-Riflebacteria-2]|jgi:Ni,Fe-hydrogenase III small subunit/ferredoxin|nr:MAG: hydrogenase [Candidatus Riflebacteria bacterium HGW-Riflebacteria-2]